MKKTIVNQHGVCLRYANVHEAMDWELADDVCSDGEQDEQAFYENYCTAHEKKYGNEFEPNTINVDEACSYEFCGKGWYEWYSGGEMSVTCNWYETRQEFEQGLIEAKKYTDEHGFDLWYLQYEGDQDAPFDVESFLA